MTGFAFAYGDPPVTVEIPLQKWFPEPASFPFFVHPFGLNKQDPSQLVVWTSKTAKGLNASGWWSIRIPSGATSADMIEPPQPFAAAPVGGGPAFEFVAGGMTDGAADKVSRLQV
jgi:hypothetical protein